MSESRILDAILGSNFHCIEEPEEPACPNIKNRKGPVLNQKTGEWVCPLCYLVVGQESAHEDDLFDDDSDDAQAAEEIESAYTAEGDRVIDQRPSDKLRVRRLNTLNKALPIVMKYDTDFAIYLSNNNYEIISKVMELEESKEPTFSTRALLPKIIAVGAFMKKVTPSSQLLKELKIKDREIINKMDALRKIEEPYRTNTIQKYIQFIGESLNTPKVIIESAIESYEIERPKNSVLSQKVRAAAWLYLQAKRANFKIKKGDIQKIRGVSRQAFNQALSSYEEQKQNTNIKEAEERGVEGSE